jgi:hypothetical protein
MALLELIERGLPAWHAQAACRDCDPAVDFTPGYGESLAPSKKQSARTRPEPAGRMWLVLIVVSTCGLLAGG